MNLLHRFSSFQKSFRFRLLLIFTILTAFMMVAFALFYVSHEISSYRKELEKEGALLGDLLAHNARLPLFAENREALMALAMGALQYGPVNAVRIRTEEGKVLANAQKVDGLRSSLGLEKSVPVLADTDAYSPESVLLGKIAEKGQTIGWVNLTLDMQDTNERIKKLAVITAMIGFGFWLLVSIGGYLVLQRVTRSFNLLMAGVKRIEGGDLGVRIPVENEDEPGRAAQAINAMTYSLGQREADNRRLQEELINSMRLEVQEEKNRLMARLIQTNKMTSLGLLVSSMSHEINNPNATIGLSAHFLDKAWRDAVPLLNGLTEEEGDFSLGGIPFSVAQQEIPNCVDKIQRNSTRIAQVIHDLRNYALGLGNKFSAGVDINQVVSSALTLLRCHTRHHEPSLKLDLENDLPTINGNPQQLEQVVINLLMNALQAISVGSGEIRVGTGLDRDKYQVTISVKDNGVGMAPEVMERLFEPFFSTRIENGGSGLGLYISNFIVNEHKGSIELQSAPGEGTTAMIRLPVVMT